MEKAIRPPRDRRVTHQLRLTHRWLQQRFIPMKWSPTISVGTCREIHTVFALVPEERKHESICFALAPSCGNRGKQTNALQEPSSLHGPEYIASDAAHLEWKVEQFARHQWALEAGLRAFPLHGGPLGLASYRS